MSADIQALQARLQQLEQDHGLMRDRCDRSDRRYIHERRRFRVMSGLALGALVGAILVSPGSRAALAQGYGTTLQQILNRLQAVETKTQFVSIGSDGEMHIVGTNLHIENGLGATNGEPNSPGDLNTPVVNGKGNLIIGYNALRGHQQDVRTGSHNLIVGDFQNYSTYGGLVAGLDCTISGPFSSVTGGETNFASGLASSVSGGSFNQASGVESTVSGGAQNSASGAQASVSGGAENIASSFSCSVSGGQANQATGTSASVGGGFVNVANGAVSTVSGGGFLTESNFAGWSGGSFETP